MSVASRRKCETWVDLPVRSTHAALLTTSTPPRVHSDAFGDFDVRTASPHSPGCTHTRTWLLSLAVIVPCLLSGRAAWAQQGTHGVPGRYHLQSHLAPPGHAAIFEMATHPEEAGRLQHVELQIAGGGTVGMVTNDRQSVLQPAPCQFRLEVGHLYRLRIADLPEFPGVELYPSIELLDAIHPPQGAEFKFPLPIVFAADEIEAAMRDRLVTKVIFLEQPQVADTGLWSQDRLPTETLSTSTNLLAEADRRGRPMAILRMGGRTPDPRNPSEILGSGGHVEVLPAGYSSSAHPSARLSGPVFAQ